MVDENTIGPSQSRLLPDRFQQPDFFVCDVFDAIPKADTASMEHPIYSIATRPDTEPRSYKNGDVTLTVTPHPEHGLPTVHDKDILIFAISQLVAAMNAGREVSRRIQTSSYDILKATNRNTSGREYENLKKALQRLAGTKINTNIRAGGRTYEREFSLIDDWGTIREDRGGRLVAMEIALNDWVFAAIQNHEVLTIHRDYFRLRSPLDRRLYELARKHCGRQKQWECSLEKLRDKVGAKSELKVFRHSLRKSVRESEQARHIPEYDLSFDRERDVLVVTPRQPQVAHAIAIPALPSDAIQEAKATFPGVDVYAVEAEWRAWIERDPAERFPKRNPAKHFLAFASRHCSQKDPRQASMFPE